MPEGDELFQRQQNVFQQNIFQQNVEQQNGFEQNGFVNFNQIPMQDPMLNQNQIQHPMQNPEENETPIDMIGLKAKQSSDLKKFIKDVASQSDEAIIYERRQVKAEPLESSSSE